MDISAIALGGMNRAEARVESTAKRVAAAAESSDSIDLSSEMVSLMEARNAFATNAKVAQTADEMNRRTLDILI